MYNDTICVFKFVTLNAERETDISNDSKYQIMHFSLFYRGFYTHEMNECNSGYY